MSEESKELFEKAKNMSLDEAYDYCLKLEYDREYSWRDGLQGGFESSMHSYDNLVDSFEDPSKIQILSDNGKVRFQEFRSSSHTIPCRYCQCPS